MKLVYAVSKWTNPYRAAARHIDAGNGHPLCGGAGRHAFVWELDEGEPTCKRCKRIATRPKAGFRILFSRRNGIWSGETQEAEREFRSSVG